MSGVRTDSRLVVARPLQDQLDRLDDLEVGDSMLWRGHGFHAAMLGQTHKNGRTFSAVPTDKTPGLFVAPVLITRKS